MGNSVLFDGHEAIATMPIELSQALDGNAWSAEGWVKLPINYYHADNLILLNIENKFSLYIEGTTGDLKFSNGIAITDISSNLLDSNKHHFAITNNLTTSKVYIDGYQKISISTSETIEPTDAITICNFVGKGDNYAFYDKVLTDDQIKSHIGSGRCGAIVNPLQLRSATASFIIQTPNYVELGDTSTGVSIYSTVISALIVRS